MKPRALLAGTLPLVLSACMTGTDYAPPPAPVASNYRAAAADRAGLSKLWWKAFDDPVLQDLVETVLDQNLDIEAALARVERARAVARLTGAALLPSGTIEFSANRTRESAETGLASLADRVPSVDYSRTKNAFDVSVGASWELDLFGGLHRQKEAATYEYQAAVASGAAMRVTVVADTVDCYLQLRTLQSRLAIAEEQSALTAGLERLVQQRYEAGEASLRELEQARTSSASVRAIPPVLRGEIEVQLNRLAVLAGKEPEAERAELDTPRAIPLAPLTDMGTPGDLLRTRPDIVAAERRLAASHERIAASLAEYYPKISLSALGGFQASTPSRLFTEPASILQAGLGLRWRLFDFKRIDAEVADARGAEREALAQYRQAVLRAAADVEDAVMLYHTAHERLLTHRSQLHSAERARTLADQAWREGEVALSELIEADRRVLEAREAAAVARGDMARATVAAYRATVG
ncbi:efflux transporter outer membrane subunit [Aurantiacibacter flavus]|uniref:Efflux transporter outer membrane subunit n=1 Tax=Aurantiacibacter flavus TaxID=3145232 RepID=A0ABV0CZT2_9SPHN